MSIESNAMTCTILLVLVAMLHNHTIQNDTSVVDVVARVLTIFLRTTDNGRSTVIIFFLQEQSYCLSRQNKRRFVAQRIR